MAVLPDDAVVAFKCDPHTVIVTVSHDPKLDDMALLEALKTDAFYIGAVGSVKTSEERRKRLALFDLSAAQIANPYRERWTIEKHFQFLSSCL